MQMMGGVYSRRVSLLSVLIISSAFFGSMSELFLSFVGYIIHAIASIRCSFVSAPLFCTGLGYYYHYLNLHEEVGGWFCIVTSIGVYA